jgi:hypothetical protein
VACRDAPQPRPTEEHRIRYEQSGVLGRSPTVRTIDVDLDARTLTGEATSILTEQRDRHTTTMLSKSDVQLAHCARAEPNEPVEPFRSGFEIIVLDGDTSETIDHVRPMTAPRAAKLEHQLATLVDGQAP